MEVLKNELIEQVEQAAAADAIQCVKNGEVVFEYKPEGGLGADLVLGIDYLLKEVAERGLKSTICCAATDDGNLSIIQGPGNDVLELWGRSLLDFADNLRDAGVKKFSEEVDHMGVRMLLQGGLGKRMLEEQKKCTK